MSLKKRQMSDGVCLLAEHKHVLWHNEHTCGRSQSSKNNKMIPQAALSLSQSLYTHTAAAQATFSFSSLTSVVAVIVGCGRRWRGRLGRRRGGGCRRRGRRRRSRGRRSRLEAVPFGKNGRQDGVEALSERTAAISTHARFLEPGGLRCRSLPLSTVAHLRLPRRHRKHGPAVLQRLRKASPCREPHYRRSRRGLAAENEGQ